MPSKTTELEERLWGAADELPSDRLRLQPPLKIPPSPGNSKLKSSEYSAPVLGLNLPSVRRPQVRREAKAKLTSKSTGRRSIDNTDYQSQGVLYLPQEH